MGMLQNVYSRVSCEIFDNVRCSLCILVQTVHVKANDL